jgi:hypothetical protein
VNFYEERQQIGSRYAIPIRFGTTRAAYLDHQIAQAVCRIPNGVHVFLEIHVYKLEDQVELLILMKDIEKPDGEMGGG